MVLARRITSDTRRSEPCTLAIDGRTVAAWQGESLAAVLLLEGVAAFSCSAGGRPRAPLCNMGTCFECLVLIERQTGRHPCELVRACMTPVESGMRVLTGRRLESRLRVHEAEDR